MTRKIYIAQTYSDFRQYVERTNVEASDSQFFSADDEYRLRGLELSPDDVVVIGNPRMTYNFWTTLQTRLRKKLPKQKRGGCDEW